MNDLSPNYPSDAAEAFATRMAGVIDNGALAVMISIGHRLGLFETLAGRSAFTSAELAAEAGLAERYVREWLAVMVTGRVVTYHAGTRRYALPAEHAACLVKGAPLGNLAVFAQHVALLGQMQDAALSFFESGEGTRYGDYPCFHQIMAEDSEQSVASALREHILPLVDGLEARLEDNLDFPMASLLYAVSCLHCTPVSLGQGGAGLGTMWGWETAEAMLKDAGFASVERHILPHDPLNVWFVSRV
jgi:hypothetical protein